MSIFIISFGLVTTNKGVISNFGLEKKKLLLEWPIVSSSKANEALSFREGWCCGMFFLENDLSSSLFSKLHRDRPILYKFKVFKATLSLQAVMLWEVGHLHCELLVLGSWHQLPLIRRINFGFLPWCVRLWQGTTSHRGAGCRENLFPGSD